MFWCALGCGGCGGIKIGVGFGGGGDIKFLKAPGRIGMDGSHAVKA